MADHDGAASRSVYAVKLGDDIYVLHSFHEKSTSGIKTRDPDHELSKTRLRRIEKDLADSKKEKRKKK